MVKTKKKEEKPKICYFCMWNDPVTEIHKGRQVFLACRYCANTMQPLVDSKGIWGWSLAALRPTHPGDAKLQNMPLLKCPNCNFHNIYQESIDHHMKYSHRPKHPFPPNIQTEASKQDWLKKVKRW